MIVKPMLGWSKMFQKGESLSVMKNKPKRKSGWEYETSLFQRIYRAIKKQSGKQLESLKKALLEVKNANEITDITDCLKMVGYDTIYRIRIGSQRAFFSFHVEIIGNIAYFLYLIPRGQAYSKEMKRKLKQKDGNDEQH